MADSTTGRTRVPVELNVDGQMRFTADVQTAFYRAAQESLNNISRHAQATKIQIGLVCNSPQATLTIHDNDRGFDPAAGNGVGMGLQIMRERIEAIGRQLELHSTARTGTTITVHWNDEPTSKGDDDK